METIMQQHSSLSPQSGLIRPPYCCKRIKLKPTSDVDDAKKLLIKKFMFERLLQEKKLSLVLDLDHTLLHSVFLSGLKPKDRNLILKETYNPNLSDLFRFKLKEGAEFVIKLRPGLENFLEEASKMFELHVFTKSSRNYAMEVLKHIDPGNIYFGCKSSSFPRIFTRENCVGRQKSLDLVMGKESGTLIVDDKEKVWRDVDKKNVMKIPMYNFFGVIRSVGRKSPQGLVAVGGRSNESETERWLSLYLGVLKMIHTMYFDPQGEVDILERDVRVLKNKVFDYLRL